MSELGEKIKSIRKQLRWSQYILAKELNITQSALSKYERGACIPPYVHLQKLNQLAKAANIQVELL